MASCVCSPGEGMWRQRLGQGAGEVGCSACCRRRARPGGTHRVREGDGERVIVLHKRCVLVVQHQLLQGPVQVIGLCEAEAGGRAVDDTVLRVAVHPAWPK